jgi:hypothetical protein
MRRDARGALGASAVVVGLVTLVVLTAAATGSVAGRDGAQAGSAAPDYTIESVSELDYHNSRGFDDRNGDGRIIVELRGRFNMSQSRDPIVRTEGPEPLVLRGGGTARFHDVPAPFLRRSGGGALVLRNLSIVDIRAEEQTTAVSASGPLTVRNVTLRDTVHSARYPGDTFADTHRVAAFRGGGDVRFRDSTVRRAGRAVAAGGSLTVRNATVAGIDTAAGGAVGAGGQAVVSHSTIANVSGGRGGAVAANSVTVRNSTLRDVRAGFSGGAVDAESAARIIDSTIRRAEAGRNGGAVAADGRVTIQNTTIVDAESDQGYSLYGYGEYALTVVDSRFRDLDPIQFGYGGISHGQVTVRGSHLVNVTRIHAADVGVRRSTAAGRLRLTGRLITVRNSTLRSVRGIDGSDVQVSDSRVRRSGRFAASQSIAVRDSVFAASAGLDGFRADDGPLTIVNSTFHGTGSPAVPPTDRRRTLERVNFVEAEPPVFVGTLPNRTDVFVDTTNDTELAGEWDADVFWSRDQPFPSIQRLDVGPTPTPTATPTPTTTGSGSATPATRTPAPTPTATPVPTEAAGAGTGDDGAADGDRGLRDRVEERAASGDGFGALPALGAVLACVAAALLRRGGA